MRLLISLRACAHLDVESARSSTVGTFPAGGHYDYFRIALFCYRVLEDCLAAAERPRDESGSAFGDGVEGVNHPDSGLHYPAGPRFLCISPNRYLYRPFLGHRDVGVGPVFIGKDGYDGVDVVRTGLFYRLDGKFALE